MGQLVDGQWQQQALIQTSASGEFVRKPSGFRGIVTANGAAGPDGRRFAAEAGRYHLVVAYACPWAHRALLIRALRGLTDVISCSATEAVMGEDGWAFAGHAAPATEGADVDPVLGAAFLRALYVEADPHYTGRVTVPLLWDRQQRTIVSNDSADIMRMFDEGFDALATSGPRQAPIAKRADIDACNEDIQLPINNGVYRCGFASSQAAYERAFVRLFSALGDMDARLGRSPFLLGDAPCESDWRLFTTLVRFDAVYVSHFRCNGRRIVDYANLWPYLRALYQTPGVRQTVRMDHIKRHYFMSHPQLNPSRIVPVGPSLDFDQPVER